MAKHGKTWQNMAKGERPKPDTTQKNERGFTFTHSGPQYNHSMISFLRRSPKGGQEDLDGENGVDWTAPAEGDRQGR